jgi:molybdenum cofactor cytidylyltransferase
MNIKLSIIILAAGEASRMGQAKQLLKLEGQTLLERCLAKAKALPAEAIVTVLGAHLAQTQPVVEAFGKGVQVAINQEWANGMGGSIAQGMHQVLATNPSTEAVLVLLADQPLVPVEKLAEMIQFYQTNTAEIVASAYHDTFGVPAIFGQAMFEHLLQLKGKTGAKKVMKQHANQLLHFAFPEATFDVDTPEDFERIKELTNTKKQF